MPATVNYIDESERKFLIQSYVDSLGGLWSSNETLESDPEIFQDAEFGSLKLSGAVSAYVKYNIWPTPATDVPSQYALTDTNENQTRVEAFCWVRPTKNCTLNISITLHKVELDGSTYMLSTDVNDIIAGEVGVHKVTIGATDTPYWHLIRPIPIYVPDDSERYSIGLTVTVEYDDPVSPGELNISRPTIYNNRSVFFNIFTMYVLQYMPEIFVDSDRASYDKAEVTFPLVRLIDAVTTVADDIHTMVNDMTYLNLADQFDPTDAGTFSTLVNPNYAPSNTLEWLAQFRGSNLVVTYEPSTDGVPWELFRLDESVLDGADVLATSTTPTTGFAGGIEEYFKWQVNTGNYGHNAGKIAGMIDAIKLLLTGTKYVDYTMTATSIHFETDIDETFGGGDLTVGDESPYVISILEPMRPLGMVITHEVVA